MKLSFFKFKPFKFYILAFCVTLPCEVFAINGNDISARSAVIICSDSFDKIWGKNENEKLPMASTTKIMTSILALQKAAAQGNQEFEITEEMINVEGTSMGLMPEDKINLETLAKGMLLPSGNDAANAAAILISGTLEKFVELMNEHGKQIGMKNTNFCTPSGLDYGNHCSTAIDMAVLGAYAMENENFSSIVRKNHIKINFSDSKRTIMLENHNKLLKLYKYCVGIKTGFTKKAGRCLVSCAEKNDVRLVAVTLNAPNDWDDHKKLYEFGFNSVVTKTFDESNFLKELPLIKGELEKFEVIGTTKFKRTFRKGSEQNLTRVVELPKSLKAPVEKGSVVGQVSYFLGNKKVGENILTVKESVPAKKRKNIFKIIGEFFSNIFKK
ncbi:MAG: D-alanyl-D-alanine carboxypeptidase [Oscillospiraceae bacterium]|jgi:D-alanyl-D-alanine carboxypeptidase/D-alanyl-D-alanine carboxypeptidase (penicillin-binding protein 5/6)|nr:D-alanyl-D-alanine carboxypeptidase [Oscillospiraceae bacterium]